jgi:hypothetical protein
MITGPYTLQLPQKRPKAIYSLTYYVSPNILFFKNMLNKAICRKIKLQKMGKDCFLSRLIIEALRCKNDENQNDQNSHAWVTVRKMLRH